MGSFLFTIGDAKIPKKRLDEFQRNILHVFDIGGMMQLEDASLFGKKVELMKPVEYEEASQTYWTCFNYFEDDFWETAGYSVKRHEVYSNKVGWRSFNRVMLLCHLMQELYSGGRCLVDGDIYGSLIKDTAWINQEFNQHFDLAYRMDLQNVYHTLAQEKWRDLESIDDLKEFMLGVTFDSIGRLMDEYLETHSIRETIRFFSSKCYGDDWWIPPAGKFLSGLVRNIVSFRLHSEKTEEEQLEEIFSVITWSKEHPREDLPKHMSKFFDILLLSRDAAFHAISYAYPIRLEDIRKKYASVYDGYVPCLELKISSNDVTEKIKKAEIDFCDIALCNSDDDSLYWWNEDAGFELSEECRNWMEAIRAESQSICNRMGDIPSYPEQLNRLLDTLMSINDTYHTLFMFKDSFYDILEIHSRESAAAVELLQRLAHRNATKFQEEISNLNYSTGKGSTLSSPCHN